MNPAQVLVLGFAGAIAVGTGLLMLPPAAAPGVDITLVDALFTATSAVCVTGLVVVDTATAWSPFGQAVILALIQVGGLGIMTMSTFLALILGKRITLRERLLIREALQEFDLAGLVRLTRYIVFTTLALEGSGAVLLTLRFLAEEPPARALWLGVFHAVSAFNNAGIDLFGTSLMGFATDPLVLGVVSLLVVLGGLGFSVLVDLWQLRAGSPLSLHTRVVLLVTAVLIAGGTLLFLALEWHNPRTLGSLGPGHKVLNALFLAISPRTAGFNAVDVAGLTAPALFLTIMLMFVGASPGSTAGGVKTTTVATVLATVAAALTGYPDVVILRRRVNRALADRALALLVLSLLLVVGVTMVLLVVEDFDFLATLFEVVSAFGTVGLSMGITPELSTAGRLLLAATMFVGRLGPLTMAYALARRQQREARIRYAEERLLVG